MSKIKLELDIRTLASIRQILFDHQKGYSYDHVPERIAGIREVIKNIDSKIESKLST